MLKDFFSLAFKNLKHRGLRSWLTILGIFIGIAAVVSLISMGQSLQTAISGQFGGLSIDKLTIQNKGTSFGPPGSTVVEKLNEHDLEIIKNINGVDKVVTRLIRVVNFEYNEVSEFNYIGDVPEEQDSIDLVYESLNVEIGQGRFLKKGDSGKVVLGSGFAKEGKFGKELRVGKNVLINGKSFEVVGILKETGRFGLSGIILMMNHDLEKLLEIDKNKEYDMIVAQVINKDKIEQVADEISRKLRRDRNEDIGEESFSVETPAQALESVNTILNVVNLIVISIAGISLFVGGVGIANTMYTSVVERTKEIGIMKAIGAQNKDILIVFLIEAGLLGLIGGIVGAVIGLAGAMAIAQFANIAFGAQLFVVDISYPLLLGAVSFSFVVGIISGILPAFQASKLNIVDALRR